MNTMKAWIALKLGHIGMRMVFGYANLMESIIPGGLPRGPMDAVANLIAEELKLQGCVLLMVDSGGWCKCGRGEPHRETHLRLSSFGLRDDELMSHLTHVGAALEGRLRVARHEQHGTPAYDA